jgi:hypothetical protein
VPRRKKALLVALTGYVALPFDLVPDFIPVAGQLDDLVIVGLVLRSRLRGGGESLVREHLAGPEQFARTRAPPRDLRPPPQRRVRGVRSTPSDGPARAATGSKRLKSASLNHAEPGRETAEKTHE